MADGAEPETEDRFLELKNVATGDLDLATEDEKKDAEEATKEHGDLFDAMKEALGDKVEKVAVSARLTDAPACITTEGPLSLEMEKVLARGPEADRGEIPKTQRVLELNAKHAVFDKLVAAHEAGDKDKLALYAGLLYDQALLVEGILPARSGGVRPKRVRTHVDVCVLRIEQTIDRVPGLATSPDRGRFQFEGEVVSCAGVTLRCVWLRMAARVFACAQQSRPQPALCRAG